MLAKARFAVAACEEWHVDENIYLGHVVEPRKVYDDLLPTMLNLDELQRVGKVPLSQEHRERISDGLRALVRTNHREHKAQPASEVKKEYVALEKALKKALHVAGKLGDDAALQLEVKLKTKLAIDLDIFDLLFRLGQFST